MGPPTPDAERARRGREARGAGARRGREARARGARREARGAKRRGSAGQRTPGRVRDAGELGVEWGVAGKGRGWGCGLVEWAGTGSAVASGAERQRSRRTPRGWPAGARPA
ncbi:hypothetical protein JCM9533A_52000 [Catenuloplanes niger JCM 9533]